MARIFICTLIALFLTSVPSLAKTSMTNDPNHQGWFEESGKAPLSSRIKRMEWQKEITDCTPCQYLVLEYNLAVEELFALKTTIRKFTAMRAEEEQGIKQLYEKDKIDTSTEGGKAHAAQVMGILMERAQSGAETDKKYAQLVRVSEARVQKLRERISDCEQQCKGDGGKTTDIGLGGQPALEGADTSLAPPPFKYEPPKWWKGPFDPVCWKCEKLAKELNERIPHEVKIRQIKIEHAKRMAKDLLNNFNDPNEYSLSSEISALERHYKKTLKMYENCIKSCKGEKTSCTYPDSSTKSISIGPNNEVGTNAATKDKLGSQAKGAAMGALNSVLGGSGVSLGGGGKGEEPKMDKDPTSGAFTPVSAGDTTVEIRSGLTDDGFVVSAKIDDTPGDGTFHAMWLEDGQGNVILPKKYWIFSLYRDWKLTVWWDYKRWQDGELVEHDHGEEVSFGREEIGRFAVWLEGAKNAIWSQLGFGTAVKGVNHIGAVFPASVASNPCPLKLVTHISLPKEDPVSTQGLSMTIDVTANQDEQTQIEPVGSDLDTQNAAQESTPKEPENNESEWGKKVRARAQSMNQ